MQQCKLHKKNGLYEIFKADYVNVINIDSKTILIKEVWENENNPNLRTEKFHNRSTKDYSGHEVSYE